MVERFEKGEKRGQDEQCNDFLIKKNEREISHVQTKLHHIILKKIKSH
jgi:hypothetical protein